MSDIGNAAADATKAKIGRIPVPVIAAVVVGGGALLYYVYGRSAASSAAPGSTTLDSTGYSTSGLSGAPLADDTSTVDNSATSPTAATNQAWISRASNAVALAFGVSQTSVYSVLYNYVNGNDWAKADQKYIDRALSDYGTPPEGTSGLGSATAAPIVATPLPPVTTMPVPPITGTPKPPVVIVKNPAPVTPPKVVTTPKPKSLQEAKAGEKVTLSKKYAGYITADAANKGGKATLTTGTGTYYVFNKVSRSNGVMLNVSRVKGAPGVWINP